MLMFSSCSYAFFGNTMISSMLIMTYLKEMDERIIFVARWNDVGAFQNPNWHQSELM